MILTDKQYQRLTDEEDKVKYRCKCGHRIIIPKYKDKDICGWCGNYVFKNKKNEFEYRLKQEMRKTQYVI